mmetsp:Transcript_7986/g.27958  ORF Transcript_7986/g.27958 Transcript_7986/m.27958 type:complete len:207 (-) Transcript_7986:996-1616(-)
MLLQQSLDLSPHLVREQHRNLLLRRGLFRLSRAIQAALGLGALLLLVDFAVVRHGPDDGQRLLDYSRLDLLVQRRVGGEGREMVYFHQPGFEGVVHHDVDPKHLKAPRALDLALPRLCRKRRRRRFRVFLRRRRLCVCSLAAVGVARRTRPRRRRRRRRRRLRRRTVVGVVVRLCRRRARAPARLFSALRVMAARVSEEGVVVLAD